MRDLSMITWKEIREIDKSKSILFVVMAPIEEHGWHLPIATDLMEGEYWSKGAMKAVEEKLGVECFYLPSFPIASASVNEFYGSIHFSMKTTYEVTYAILDSAGCMGFQNIIIIASHADPQHQIAIEKAVRKINRKHGICAIAPMGQIFMGVFVKKSDCLERFEKEHENDYHAGWVETSCLHLHFTGGFSKVWQAHKQLRRYADQNQIQLAERVYEVYRKDMTVDVYYAVVC